MKYFCCWWQKENFTTLWPVQSRVRGMKLLASRLRMWYCADCPEISHTSWDGDRWVKWWLAGRNLNSENTLIHFQLVHHKSHNKDLMMKAWTRDSTVRSRLLTVWAITSITVAWYRRLMWCAQRKPNRKSTVYIATVTPCSETSIQIQSRVPYGEKQSLGNKIFCRDMSTSISILCSWCPYVRSLSNSLHGNKQIDFVYGRMS